MTTAAALLFCGCAATDVQNGITTQKKCLDRTALEQKEYEELLRLKSTLFPFKTGYNDTIAYINFLNVYVADYGKYIQTASYASSAIAVMPIPYAGQISSAANFASKITTLAANASRANTNLYNSLIAFEAKLSAYEKSKDPAKLHEAGKFANEYILPESIAAENSTIKLKEGANSLLAAVSMATTYTGAISDAAAKVGSLWNNEKEPKKMDDKALKTKNEGIDKKLETIIASMNEAQNLVKTSNKIMELYAPL